MDAFGMFATGTEKERAGDLAEAEQLYQQAAAAGEPRSMGRLGLLAEKLLDFARAEEWYRKASAAGDRQSDFWIGRLYEDHYGNLEEARRWYQKAASADEWRAADRLKAEKFK